MMLPLQIAFIFEQTLHSWIQTTLNQVGVVDPTVRDIIESDGHNKSIHNIESFQTFRHYIMYICYRMGKAFLHKMMSSWQHSRRCTLNIQIYTNNYTNLLHIPEGMFLYLFNSWNWWKLLYLLYTDHWSFPSWICCNASYWAALFQSTINLM